MFLEMKQADQKLLDDYDGDQAQLLRERWSRGAYVKYGKAHTEAFRDLVHEAWRLKIPVIAIDSEYSIDNDGRLRTADSYWAAKYDEARTSLPTGTRVLVVAGYDHGSFASHIGIPTIDDVAEISHVQVGRRLELSDPGTVAYDPGARAWPEPEHKTEYSEDELDRYLRDSEKFIEVRDGATFVVNRQAATPPQLGSQ